MSYDYDLNDAEPNTFELIPDNEHVPVIFRFIQGDDDDHMHPTKDRRARLVKLEATVTAGPYARRKLFLNLMLATNDTEDEGHKKACEITRSTLRAIVEAARGFGPTDETAPAIAARKLKELSDLDGLECTVVVGVEKGEGKFADKSIVKRIVPVGKPSSDGDASKPSAAKPKAAVTSKPKADATKAW